MKTCSDCKRHLVFACFHARKNRNGYYSVCKGCQKARWRVASAKSRARTEAWEPERVPYVPPVDFLPMPPPLERVALVYPTGYRVAA